MKHSSGSNFRWIDVKKYTWFGIETLVKLTGLQIIVNLKSPQIIINVSLKKYLLNVYDALVSDWSDFVKFKIVFDKYSIELESHTIVFFLFNI